MLKLLRMKDNTMLVCGDVVCLHCSHLVGQLVARAAGDLRGGVFKASRGSTCEQDRRMPLRCDRCGGSVYIEEVRPFTLTETMTPAEPVERKRRRRRRKSAEVRSEELAEAS